MSENVSTSSSSPMAFNSETIIEAAERIQKAMLESQADAFFGYPVLIADERSELKSIVDPNGVLIVIGAKLAEKLEPYMLKRAQQSGWFTKCPQ